MPSIYPVACHTDNVGSGSTFVAIKGYKHDGVRFIAHAIERGATRVVIQHDVFLDDATQQLIRKNKTECLRVSDTRAALADLSAQAAGYPARKLTIFGITGTKGKTTSAFILKHVLDTAGYATALLSTAGNCIADTTFTAPLTTQQPDYLHQFFAQCVQANVTHVVMEVAAQAVTLHRVRGITFAGVLFTNFAREHAEFYESQRDYFAAKAALLHQSDGPSVVNADDLWCQQLKHQKLVTFGIDTQTADYRAQDIQQRDGIVCTINDTNISCPELVGRYNVYNLLSVTALAHACGIAYSTMQRAAKTMRPVPGRMQQYKMPNGATFIIDYAHNPSSYEQLLSMLRELTPHLIVVFGAGGGKDVGKRPIMGDIAVRHADLVVLTSDNPRNEDPYAIMDTIEAGVPADVRYKIVREVDRERAMQCAYDNARDGSIIAVLGKGTDEYQIIGDATMPFSEHAIIMKLQQVR